MIELGNKGQKVRTLSVTLVLVVLLAIAVVISLMLGQFHISLEDMGKIFLNKLIGIGEGAGVAAETALLKVRIPRIIAAVVVGGAMASAGASYQGLFQNPMVSPDLLGASSGAGFGAAFALLMDMGPLEVQFLAFVCGLAAVGATYGISTVVSRGENSTLTLVLTGMVVSTLCSSFISIVKFVADPDSKLPAITFWLMGGLNNMTNQDLPMLLIPIMIGAVPMLLLRYRLNVLSFGEEEAKALGVDTKSVRLVFIVCSTLMTSASVAAAGMIGWVGLVIPHLARMIVGPNYKDLLPVSLLLGSIYLILIDNIARCLFSLEIPLGILTSIIGAPFFIYLLMHGRKSWA